MADLRCEPMGKVEGACVALVAFPYGIRGLYRSAD